MKQDLSGAELRSQYEQTLATYGDPAGLLLDRWVSGETPGSFRAVVRVSAEVLVQDAVRLRGIELPADRQVRRQTGKQRHGSWSEERDRALKCC